MKKQNIKGVTFLLMLLIGAAGCTSNIDSINPDDHLSKTEKEAVKKAIIRYIAKPSDDEEPGQRFTSKFDKYYNEQAASATLEFYAVKDDYHYYLISQPAPSMIKKRHATAGRFKLNDKGEIMEYEEIFRTWKMKPEDLTARSKILFTKLIRGESLEKYYTKNSGDQYIEFPDDRTYYDREAREWKFK